MPSRCHVHVYTCSCQCYVYLSHGAVSWSTICACGIRGSRGGRGSGPSPEIGYPSNTGLDPLKNQKARKPAFNVGPSSARQRRNAI